METRKLYYEDCCLKEFTARVTGCEEAKGGWAVTLDATAFYPEGGGQAPDKGTLNGIAVLDVQEKGEAVTHLCEAPLIVGTTVTGCIDWPYRFDRMQHSSNAARLYFFVKFKTPRHIRYVCTSNLRLWRIRLMTSTVFGPTVMALRTKYGPFHSA